MTIIMFLTGMAVAQAMARPDDQTPKDLRPFIIVLGI